MTTDLPPTVQAMLGSSSSQVGTAPLRDFAPAYAADDNLWWRIPPGHLQNLFEAALGHIEAALAIHAPVDFHTTGRQTLTICANCRVDYPCPTAVALGTD